jgi:hypothetical protein
MELLQLETYQFNELSDSAKEKAIEIYRINFSCDSFYAGCVLEDACDIAELFGLDIRLNRVVKMDKSVSYESSIYYFGFGAQGDGACFTGKYEYKKGALKAVKEHAPQDKELYRIVLGLQELQRKNFYRVVCTMTPRGRYYHSGCMNVDCENYFDSYIPVVEEDSFVELMRDFANWIYNRLEDEYHYENLDTTISEVIEMNDYRFTIEGEFIE